ncbi:ATP-binding protein [Streptomyces sp. NPDC003077]|uniref:ATP-binding protein n=1 Tax=Streptomyces sp. NPDC003077 TaxID=3154443 RepID=UPI0033A8F915
MNSETSPAPGTPPRSPRSASTSQQARDTHTARQAREFSMRFTSSPRGARLARQLVSCRLDAWGHPYTCRANETLTQITAELTANAVRHGHVAGRDFHLRLIATADTLRVEVTDTRAERMPPGRLHQPQDDATSGRGLLIVARLATRWAVTPRTEAPGKTVWAEVGLR